MAPHGYLVEVTQINTDLLRQACAEQHTVLAIVLHEETDRQAFSAALREVRAVGLLPYAWIEVGRDQRAAAAHPEWLNTPWHPEWLAAFPDWQTPEGMMPAVAPWVSVHTRAVFDYALARITRLLAGWSQNEGLQGIFLNDIQGGPTGCGCGNELCRSWDVSPGAKVAPSPFTHTEDYFTVRFLEAVTAACEGLHVIPVICSECEIGVTIGGIVNPDLSALHCHGVTCGNPCGGIYYPGLIRALSSQTCVGLLSFYQLFGRNIPLYGDEAAWCAAILDGYRQQQPDGQVISVLQGWNVDDAAIEAQIVQSRRGGANGQLIALCAIDQSWWPVAVPARELHLEGHLCGAAS